MRIQQGILCLVLCGLAPSITAADTGGYGDDGGWGCGDWNCDGSDDCNGEPTAEAGTYGDGGGCEDQGSDGTDEENEQIDALTPANNGNAAGGDDGETDGADGGADENEDETVCTTESDTEDTNTCTAHTRVILVPKLPFPGEPNDGSWSQEFATPEVQNGCEFGYRPALAPLGDASLHEVDVELNIGCKCETDPNVRLVDILRHRSTATNTCTAEVRVELFEKFRLEWDIDEGENGAWINISEGWKQRYTHPGIQEADCKPLYSPVPGLPGGDHWGLGDPNLQETDVVFRVPCSCEDAIAIMEP